MQAQSNMAGVQYTIGGVSIHFPCKAYPSQLAMMNSVSNTDISYYICNCCHFGESTNVFVKLKQTRAFHISTSSIHLSFFLCTLTVTHLEESCELYWQWIIPHITTTILKSICCHCNHTWLVLSPHRCFYQVSNDLRTENNLNTLIVDLYIVSDSSYPISESKQVLTFLSYFCSTWTWILKMFLNDWHILH